MSGHSNQYALEWFKKGDEDGLSVTAILKEGGAPSTACFLSQQIAEKYLKGLLVFNNISFSKVHDLLELESLLLERSPEIADVHQDLQRLNRYYIETRYPGDFPEFTLKEAQEAFESAKRVKKSILDQAGVAR